MSTHEQILQRAVQLHKAGEIAQAEALCAQIVREDPSHAEAWNLMGILAFRVGKAVVALDCFAHAADAAPAVANHHSNCGAALHGLGRLPEAAVKFKDALRLDPAHADAHNNLGSVLRKLGRADESAASYRKALELKPDAPDTLSNLANLLWELGRYDEALENFRQVVKLKPTDPAAHHLLALLLLMNGDYENGWTEFEWRWHLKDFQLPPYPRPLWDGSPLEGRTILLHAEQGFGDTIHFARYAARVKRFGARVVVSCQPSLVALLRSCPGIDQAVGVDRSIPSYDVHASLLSLPRLCGTTVGTIPAPVPYLDADPALVSAWANRLAGVSGFKVGIVWQGNPLHKKDRLRSVPLTEFEPLAQVPGVSLVSLQVGHGQEQVAMLGNRFRVTDVGSQFDPACFRDAAAVIKNLDLVITVDTAMAHLAGAMGAPVWVVVPFVACWRWLRETEESPWYPTMRLFRQRRAGDWEDVFARLALALEAARVTSTN